MKLAVGPISREQALAVDPKYVSFTEGKWDDFDHVEACQAKLKRGQLVLATAISNKKQFIIAKVTQVNHNDFRAVDGPVVRISDNTGSWRVDGDGYCVPAKETK